MARLASKLRSMDAQLVGAIFVAVTIVGIAILGVSYLMNGTDELSQPKAVTCLEDTVMQPDGSCKNQEN